ncbi:Killer toxin, Kp4/SMK-like, core [Akanthomyces lecanii RCEF 1005]|uniref:Killer toxin, Kp4/SMK-like, core n=1 Tax=Akanthomyces lecanii RCEF 1005 TaxID=1081108 RepID=A0A168GYW9_CORDF|nr:Killer toxin, Kp4/SMK-like, core [Akanthomyces lecanii RCEF 1005]
MVSSRTLFTFTLAATALGINCRDSGACNLNNASLPKVLTQVPQVQAQGNDRHHYATGVQLACSGGKYSRIAFYQTGASRTTDRAADLLQG